MIDWRKLYAANQAAIARSGVAPTPPAKPSPLRRIARPAAPAGAGFESRPSAGGGLRALVHVPRGLDAVKPAPLVCMLHGCTQDGAKFAAATLMNAAADRHGFVVVYPDQDRSRNAQGCWNWFLREHQQRDTGEPAAIATIVGDLIDTSSQCTIDPERVFVAGLSSGGAMAAILGACYPDLFAAVAVHSGLPYGAATSTASAFAAMARGRGDPDADADAQGRAAHAAMGVHARAVRSIVIHGNADPTVAPANAVAVLRQSMVTNHLAAPDICNHDPAHPTSVRRARTDAGRPYTQSKWLDTRGAIAHELVTIDGLGHAWAGGAAGGSYTDPRAPSATDAIWAFFASSSPPPSSSSPSSSPPANSL